MMNRIKQLLRIGFITNHGHDSGTIPRQQISYHGKKGNSTSWLPYGFHSVAKNDSLCLVLAPNANSEERVHIATSMTNRPKLNPGEVAIFHPGTGAIIKMNSEGNIEITAPEVTLNGNLTITGSLNVEDGTFLSTIVQSDGQNISNTHIHSGSATAPSGSVSNTGTPVP